MIQKIKTISTPPLRTALIALLFPLLTLFVSVGPLAAAERQYAKIEELSTSRFLVYINPHGKRVFTDQPINKKNFVLIYPRAADIWRPKPISEKEKHRYDSDILFASRSYGVSHSLIKAVIHAESLFDKNAVSRAGAQGLMQLMPKTAQAMGVHNSFNARQNIQGGTKYLKYLMGKFDNNLTLIIAAYNAGEGNVRRYNGIPPFKETQHYVKKVLKLTKKYSTK